MKKTKPKKIFQLSRFPKWVLILSPILALLLIVGFFAVGWIFSSKIMAVNLQKVEFDQLVTKVDGSAFTITGSAYNVDGIIGGIRNDGSMIGVYSAPLEKQDPFRTSVRTLHAPHATPPAAGEWISLQGNIWTTDPKTALGVNYSDVTYDGPLGKMGAWFIPARDLTSQKWVIAVHGIGAHKQEMLRFVMPVQASGGNMLIINYRNDSDNPKSPDGHAHLGDTEWRDLEAAVAYAKGRGATEIQLYGVSLGGSITENYLRRSGDVANTNITKVMLDSPALNFNEILRFQAKRNGYSSFVFFPATVTANLRAGINMERISTGPEDIKHKTLIVHNIDDPTVPQAASKKLADARPDLVQFVDFGSGGHARAWNHDQVRYEQLVTEFLK